MLNDRSLSKVMSARIFHRIAIQFILFFVIIDEVSGQLIIDAQIRPRSEYRIGFKTLLSEEQEAAFFTEQRSRLGLTFIQDNLKIKLSAQDVRIWGETGQINKSDDLNSIYEAWGQYDHKKWSIKVGRQPLAYDDERILGALDWAAQGRSHDALKISYQDSTFSFDTGIAYNQDGNTPEPVKLNSTDYNTPSGIAITGGGLPNYKHLQFLWLNKEYKHINLSALLLNIGWQVSDSSVNNLTTLGTNLQISAGSNVTFSGSYYYQLGKNRTDQEVSAYLLSNRLTLSLNTSTNLTVGNDIVSGTGQDETESTTFDPLFGTHHKFYGLMDYFYVGNPHSQQNRTVGLIDTYLILKKGWSKKHSSIIQLHNFQSAIDLINPETGESASNSLGWELDLVTHYKINPNLKISGGYSQLLADDSMEFIKNGDANTIQNWVWVMLNFTISKNATF